MIIPVRAYSRVYVHVERVTFDYRAIGQAKNYCRANDSQMEAMRFIPADSLNRGITPNVCLIGCYFSASAIVEGEVFNFGITV
ncbi:TPA: hypothetical protein ACIR6N_002251 [Enterobacter hormaechei]